MANIKPPASAKMLLLLCIEAFVLFISVLFFSKILFRIIVAAPGSRLGISRPFHRGFKTFTQYRALISQGNSYSRYISTSRRCCVNISELDQFAVNMGAHDMCFLHPFRLSIPFATNTQIRQISPSPIGGNYVFPSLINMELPTCACM